MKILYISSTMSGIHTKGIYSDLMSCMRDNGHEVYVIYAREQRLNLKTECYEENDINYLGVRTGNITKNHNFIQKGISTIMLDYHFIQAYKKNWKEIEFDLVLMSTPPITMIKTLKYIKKKNENAFLYLMLKDIFPQNAVDLKLLTFAPLIKYFEVQELHLYNLFDYIGVMSERNKQYILSEYPSLENKIEIFPNTLMPRDNQYSLKRSDFNIPENKTCLFYGGNLGKPQGVDFLLETVKKVAENENLFFVIAGSGSDDYKIREYLDLERPNNVLFTGHLENETYHNLIHLTDIGLIYLDYRFTIPNYPQRLLGYLECSKPVVCATDDSTDIGTDAETNKYGYKVPSNDSDLWMEKVMKLVNNPELRTEMGKNGYEYFMENFTVDRSYSIIMNHFDGRK